MDPEVRLSAAQILVNLGPEGETIATAVITRLLKDKTWPFRYRAIEALDKMGPKAKLATATLKELVNDDDIFVGRGAAEVLEKIGKKN